MIDREQVLHVARLARLELSDDEVARMATELSGILDHVDRMSQIELEGVAPTTHVIEVTGARRADEPRPSWPRETMLEQAPAEKDGGFLVPSPQAP
jgi:aspartyl-tRNA(Asn)/glutamyl-tRNA(Gln) amidotransferase subunit C